MTRPMADFATRRGTARDKGQMNTEQPIFAGMSKPVKENKHKREERENPVPAPGLPASNKPPSSEILITGEAEEISELLYERMNLLVDKGQEPMRLDKFLTARIENISRNKVQQAIDGGRVLVKTGAEGVYAAILPDRGWGLALKVTDGATRAAETALAALLDHLGVMDDALHRAFAAVSGPVIKNWAGLSVGRIGVADDIGF